MEEASRNATNRTFQLDTSRKFDPGVSAIQKGKYALIVASKGMKYPLVSGSYESVYPRLSPSEIAALMPQIDKAISKASVRYHVDEAMIRAMIQQESSFQPYALSTSGAMGLMQLMPGTAQWLSVTDPYDIEQNIMGGTRYFRDQLEAFDGNTELALAAYNAGPNAVRKHNGVPPFSQTQHYVKSVMEYYAAYHSSLQENSSNENSEP